MPISVAGLQELPAGRPITVVSPLLEMGSALHVLADPSHHQAGQWAADVRSALGPGLARRTTAWAWASQAIRAAPFLSPSTADFDTELDRLRSLPARQLAARLLRPISRAGDLTLARRWSRSRDPAVTARVETLIEQPAEGAAEFLDFLAETWTAWFGAEWQRVEPIVRAATRRLGRQMAATRSVAKALAALDSAITAAADDSGVTIAKIQSARHDVSHRGLAVALSHFVWPHIYVANVPGQPLLMICPAEPHDRPGALDTVPQVMSRLAALAHRGRLEVARAIATEPRTAGEIAALWRMDATLVNRHLRALAAAGLARTTRRGRFVQYGLDHDAVRGLGNEVMLLLLR
jgi:DNA-binding transcriptional ArsR family regulator